MSSGRVAGAWSVLAGTTSYIMPVMGGFRWAVGLRFGVVMSGKAPAQTNATAVSAAQRRVNSTYWPDLRSSSIPSASLLSSMTPM